MAMIQRPGESGDAFGGGRRKNEGEEAMFRAPPKTVGALVLADPVSARMSAAFASNAVDRQSDALPGHAQPAMRLFFIDIAASLAFLSVTALPLLATALA